MIAGMIEGLRAVTGRPARRPRVVPLARLMPLLMALSVAGCSFWSSPTATPAPTPTPSPTDEPASASPEPSADTGSFQTAGGMNVSRIGATATLLTDGRVLIAGGTSNGHAVSSAELFNPRTGAFAATGSMTEARAWHTANLLPTGSVLICGGSGDRSCELFNPNSGKFSRTGGLGYAPYFQTATTLGDGRVLVAGGFSSGAYTTRAEIYSSANGRFIHVRSLKDPRQHAVAVLLQDGRVLIAGGDQGASGKHAVILASAELFNAVHGTFTRTGSMLQARSHFAAVVLQNGKVLVTGGVNLSASDHLLFTAELFDPNTGTWSRTGTMAVGRSDFTATLLADGRVLVAGGGDATTEIYDPDTGTFQMGGSMLEPRVSQTATVLVDGRLLMAGGNVGGGTGAELFNP
jgi:WD40 repeat protein